MNKMKMNNMTMNKMKMNKVTMNITYSFRRLIHFNSAKEWKQFMFPKIDATRIKRIRNISENDMIHKPRILKYPYFKMKKVGKYSKIIPCNDINNEIIFNREIEILYDHRYCSIFEKLKDIISSCLKGITIKSQCTDNFCFEIYDCLENKILINKKGDDLKAETLFKELIEKIKLRN